ncbi:MAG TPA: hypothetical protein VJ227_02245, partial [Patescibacteria group bacterium]|nr:hypothetical protein [Patescibacteria group bacterium]
MTERNEGRGPEKGPFFKFVYSRHALEDAPQVWERLRDCDVILLENILPDETEKVAGNKLLREAVGNKAKKN